jgi:hypothetical protein
MMKGPAQFRKVPKRAEHSRVGGLHLFDDTATALLSFDEHKRAFPFA